MYRCFVAMLVASSIALVSQSVPVYGQARLPLYIDQAAGVKVTAWLTHHPDFRLLNDGDCNCDDDLREMRRETEGVWVRNPGYHPYYVTGDFDGNGQNDIAIGVARRGDKSEFQVLILKSLPDAKGKVGCTFLSRRFDLGEGLFFGPPRPKPYRLLVGPFASEGFIFVPRRGCRYVLR